MFRSTQCDVFSFSLLGGMDRQARNLAWISALGERGLEDFKAFGTEGSLVTTCATKRKPPVLPDAFDVELEDKSFTNGKDDFPAVAKLYRDAFKQRFASVEMLVYANLDWGDKEVGQADPGVEV